MKLDTLRQPVSILTGIGGHTASQLDKLGVRTILDLLFHLPVRYEDRTCISPIASLSSGMTALVVGNVEFVDVLPRGRKSLVCRISDSTGFVDLRFFHFTVRQYHSLKPGTKLSCFGEPRFGYAGLEMVHPEYKVISEYDQVLTDPYLTPIYPLTEGLTQNTLRKAVKQAISICENNRDLLKDWLTVLLSKDACYPTLLEAIKTVHTPDKSISLDILSSGHIPALKRLALEELLTHHLSLKLSRHKAKTWQAPKFNNPSKLTEPFLNAFPYKLTEAQQRVIAEISEDCTRLAPMMRLVQGDVGCGKTIVAAFAALLALEAGYQVAIMAPTELLAEQHYRNFSVWFWQFNFKTVLLTGQLKGKPREEALNSLLNGSTNIIIGTHALFQDEVNFCRLGLVIIDEQHRFGVHQRLALRAKGQQNNMRPHQLVMTATPIPRTLAMLQYADLDISLIDQLPPGRKPVTTSAISSDRRDEVIARINHWVTNQKQAYWVCTLIEESDVLELESAENTAERLTIALPAVRIALLHGRLKPSDKEAIMQAFKNHEIDLLVATTVIEVGVDVPNASLMVIENPERLGLSQLHQLRGRVGRGSDESFCLLMYQQPLTDNARQRLGVIRDSSDGFFIAEKDLQLRGPGEVMGTRQAGLAHFKIADLVRDADLLDNIPTLADKLISDYPQAIAPLIDRWSCHHNDYAEV